MTEENTVQDDAKRRFSWTKKNKIIAAAAAAALVVAVGAVVGVTTYNANTRELCRTAAVAYADGYNALTKAHAAGDASVKGATDTESVENIEGFVGTDEQRAAEGYEPAEGDALVDAVRSAQADNPLPTEATSTCDNRSEAADVKDRAGAMIEQAAVIQSAANDLDEAVYAYQMAKALG